MNNENVLIVAAKSAINDYKNFSCYICQENRKFRPNSAYMAFYYKNKISIHIPKILGYIDAININNPELNSSELINVSSNKKELTDRLNIFLSMAKDNPKWVLNKNKIIILSSIDDPRTIVLNHEIKNNKTSKYTNIRVPFTQSNRYSTITKLKNCYFTKELEE